jgi:hypothetical protein
MSDTTLTAEIEFPLEGTPKVRTNIKREFVSALLTDFIQGQRGSGPDPSKVEERDVYHITMQIDPSDKSFYLESDTGRAGLTCGIIINIIGRIEKGEVEFLEYPY